MNKTRALTDNTHESSTPNHPVTVGGSGLLNSPEPLHAYEDFASNIDFFVAKLAPFWLSTIKKEMHFLVYPSQIQNSFPFDENMYICFKELINFYEKALSFDRFFNSTVISADIRDLVHGLFNVLQSRVSLFEDNKNKFFKSTMDVNPIGVEKMELINRYKRRFIESFDGATDNYLTHSLFDIQVLSRNVFLADASLEHCTLFYNQLFSHLSDTVLIDLHDVFVGSSRSLIDLLSSMEEREVALFYHDYLLEEVALLDSIMENTMETLEAKLKTTFLFANFKEALQEIIYTMNGAHLFIHQALKNIEDEATKAIDEKEAVLYENLDDFILACREIIFSPALLTNNPVLFWQDNMRMRHPLLLERLWTAIKQVNLSLSWNEEAAEKKDTYGNCIELSKQSWGDIAHAFVEEYEKIIHLTESLRPTLYKETEREPLSLTIQQFMQLEFDSELQNMPPSLLSLNLGEDKPKHFKPVNLESDSRELDKKELDNRELDNKELDNKELDNRELDKKELDNRKLDNRELENRELDNRELDNKELDNRELDNTELDNRELDNRALGNRELGIEASETSPLTREMIEIIEGINETLIIKIEGLREQIAWFEKQMEETIVDLGHLSLAPNEADIKIYVDQLNDRLLHQLIHSEKSAYGPIIHGFYQAHDGAALIAKILSPLDDILSQSHKIEKRFLVDDLLYEIISLEEILYYSVERLRGKIHPSMTVYIDAMDQAFYNLHQLLEREGIQTIMPESHDIFNGKEHEILLAEENEAFAKGEIIKRFSLGFKKNDLILVRANVVAAK